MLCSTTADLSVCASHMFLLCARESAKIKNTTCYVLTCVLYLIKWFQIHPLSMMHGLLCLLAVFVYYYIIITGWNFILKKWWVRWKLWQLQQRDLLTVSESVSALLPSQQDEDRELLQTLVKEKEVLFILLYDILYIVFSL